MLRLILGHYYNPVFPSTDVVRMNDKCFYLWAGQGSDSGRGSDPSLCHYIKTSRGSHQASYPVSSRGSLLGIKWPGHKAGHSPPSSAKIKNA
jgi:hypothetical protein